MLKIGSYTLPSNILLAPMAGCTDLAFRLIAREHGAAFSFFEMVDSNCVAYGPRKKVRALLKTAAEDSPIAAQILGRDPGRMLDSAKEVIAIANPSFVDINAACPAKKVIKKRCGAYLVEDAGELTKIIKTLAAALPLPVTVKIRTGCLEADRTGLAKLAGSCEDAGAAAIFIHGRTRTQGYSGEVDYASIRAVKEAVRIPVIGSGNVFTPELAGKMLAETGCDGLLAARGALGNPWIFGQIASYLKDGRYAVPAREERVRVLRRHLAYIETHKELRPSGKMGFMRKTALWYLKGFPDAAELRHRISLVSSREKMIELIDGL